MLKKKELKNFLLYLIVGGGATLVEWITFYTLCILLKRDYLVSTVIAYIISTYFNWLFGRILLFSKSKKGIVFEILSIYGTSVLGLIGNLIIMWFAVDIKNIPEMIAKIVATGIIFIWNYCIRRFFIYKNSL